MGLMIAEEAKRLGARVACLDESPDAPASHVSDEFIVAPFDDAAALEELCRRSDVVTYEFENIPAGLLTELERKYRIPQGFKPLFDSQDRLREKTNARENGLTPPDFVPVNDPDTLRQGIGRLGFPCVYKTRTLGYDGHGQVVLHGEQDIARVLPLLDVPGILERFVPFDYEASVVMVSDGERVIHFPVGQNIHRDGILDLCLVPAPRMSGKVREEIVRQSEAFMRRCGYRGILAIEYFVQGDRIYFNEMAPRPHNSGHYTIEGCDTNQYRELCRFLLGMPLMQPVLKYPTVMKNILGQDMPEAMRIAGEGRERVHVHLYGKTQCKPKRKMGHITFTEMTETQFRSDWERRFV